MNFKLQEFETPMVVSAIANIHYFEFTNQYHTIEHKHNFCELLYVDKGAINVSSENFKGMLNVNNFIIHRPNEVHSLESTSGAAPNVIIIGFECKSPELITFAHKAGELSPEQTKCLARIMQEGMSIFEPPYDIPYTTYMKKRAGSPFGADQMIKINLESLLISIVRNFKSNNNAHITASDTCSQSVRAVYQYISEHYTEKITLDNLCFLFGTNKTTLCRDFKTEFGTTLLSYITELRIKDAKMMLRSKEISVTEISEKLGYDSIHYFCRIFKQETGQSPTQYAKSIRAKLNI